MPTWYIHTLEKRHQAHASQSARSHTADAAPKASSAPQDQLSRAETLSQILSLYREDENLAGVHVVAKEMEFVMSVKTKLTAKAALLLSSGTCEAIYNLHVCCVGMKESYIEGLLNVSPHDVTAALRMNLLFAGDHDTLTRTH